MSDRELRFRRLFDACYQPLHAFARRRLPPADADDLVADVLLTAWRRLDDVPSDALPWLYGVARRSMANQRRSAGRRHRLLLRIAADRPADATPPDLTHILEVLGRLRPDDQEILRLAAWEDLSAAEIAVALECTPNAAALRLSRARKRLRDEATQTALPTTHHGRVTDA